MGRQDVRLYQGLLPEREEVLLTNRRVKLQKLNLINKISPFWNVGFHFFDLLTCFKWCFFRAGALEPPRLDQAALTLDQQTPKMLLIQLLPFPPLRTSACLSAYTPRTDHAGLSGLWNGSIAELSDLVEHQNHNNRLRL